ncbi:hypothetical protein DRQ07_00570 [candidate division KSB1 bacterium]|nr:MAG: hypothetical protein DRQ07_00570 [candidate division KSB1 bacterium]
MDKYYYFIAQLPAQKFNKETFMTTDLFLAEADKWLSVRDLNILKNVDVFSWLGNKKDPYVVKQYKIFEERLRTELARWREEQKRGREYKTSLFPSMLLKEGNPLEKEEKLLQLRWDYISELEENHNFDLDFLILYYLKLQIQDHLAMFDPEKGIERFQKLCKV